MKGDTKMKRVNMRTTIPILLGGLLLTVQLLFFPITQVSAEIDRAVTLAAGHGASTEATVNIHNRLTIAASVVLQRAGSDNSFERRRVRLELINPSNQVVDSLNVEIGHDLNQTVSGRNGSNSSPYRLAAPNALGGTGCRGWKVTLKDVEADAGRTPDPSTQQITGTVKFFTVGSTTATIDAPAKFGIVQSDTVERNINVPFTGDVKIQANWDTDEITLDNFQLHFSLINTKGEVVDSDTGYSRDSVILGISDSQRMKITYRAKCTDFGGSSSWKIRVKGSSLGKVKNVDLKMSISDGLF
ncbi:MAG: hypothetical protein C5B55_01105 [Blastocatellia bacterium]|nr:MAG: hypothetical protein C5B55_01105 [Blastocatellia bacterium]